MTKAKKPAKAAAKPSSRVSRYRAHPMLGRERGMAARIESETGRPLRSWIDAARKARHPNQKTCAAWLREKHELRPMAAMWVASYAFNEQSPEDYEDPEKLVGALYSGPREALRPLHEKVVDAALALGDDVVVTSCKTMVPFYRKHVFAEARPVDGGVEVQLALGDVPAKGRLEAARGRMLGDRVAHQVVVRSAKDVDAEFKGWLARAYELGAGAIARKTDVATPPDVAKALAASKPATATWAQCTPAMRRDFVQWIVSAKQEETRTRRVAQAVEKLAAGKRRMY